jgi:hypothetical protein
MTDSSSYGSEQGFQPFAARFRARYELGAIRQDRSIETRSLHRALAG